MVQRGEKLCGVVILTGCYHGVQMLQGHSDVYVEKKLRHNSGPVVNERFNVLFLFSYPNKSVCKVVLRVDCILSGEKGGVHLPYSGGHYIVLGTSGKSHTVCVLQHQFLSLSAHSAAGCALQLPARHSGARRVVGDDREAEEESRRVATFAALKLSSS